MYLTSKRDAQMIKWIQDKYFKWKMKRHFKKKAKEAKKRDPYTYD